MTASRRPILGVGEILLDLLPDGPQLGGAPFNFAFHVHRLGWPALVLSRVGGDGRGDAIRSQVRSMGLSDEFLQIDPDHPTGTVAVRLDSGQPTYTIHTEVAYDHLAFEERWLALQPAAICFGTLAQRGAVSRRTISRLVRTWPTATVVFDVNLRQQFWTAETIADSLDASDWLKVNEDELAVFRSSFALTGDDREALRSLARRFDLELVCLTRGAAGCLVVTADEVVEEPGVRVEVVDTIGAGDSFTAALLVGVLEGRPLVEAVRRANRLASRVASARGGTPTVELG